MVHERITKRNIKDSGVEYGKVKSLMQACEQNRTRKQQNEEWGQRELPPLLPLPWSDSRHHERMDKLGFPRQPPYSLAVVDPLAHSLFGFEPVLV